MLQVFFKRRFLISLPVLVFPALLFYLVLDPPWGGSVYGGNGLSADAVVVLTGGKGRVEEGLRLLGEGAGETLILSGVNGDAEIDTIFLEEVPEGLRRRIILEKKSGSTYRNAVEVKAIMEERGLRSMVLVTSGYHMKRALYIFGQVMGPGVTILPHPVSTSNFDEERWWERGTLTIRTIESLKYGFYRVRFAVLS